MPALLRPTLCATIVVTSAVASADPKPAPVAPVPAPTATAANETPTNTTKEDPPIAPPEPNAPEKKIEDAKAVAKKAELTPIIPSPKNPTRPAFQLYAEIDPPILAVGTVFALARLTKTQQAFCAPACDSSGLNGVDRLTAGYYSSGWSSASDYALWGLGAGAAVLLTTDEGVLSTLNDAVVIGEATLTATAAASIMTLAAGRPRPFLYGDASQPDSFKAPLTVRTSADAGLSFLSSHTAEAFAIATSLFVAERRLHPHDTKRAGLVLGVGLGVASFIGAARVMSGYHFITDVAGGAVVGSALGVLVGSVHGSPVHVVPVVNEQGPTGAGIQGAF